MIKIFTFIIFILFPLFSYANGSYKSAWSDSVVNIYTPIGSGSGFIVNESGYIITNHHVVDRASHVTVRINNERIEYRAKVIEIDIGRDLALLHVPRMKKEPLPLRVDTIPVGMHVWSLGYPGGATMAIGGLKPSVTEGVVSRSEISDKWGASSTHVDIIQHTSTINPGNSGGPLVDDCGAVVGVNTAGATNTQGVFFASNIDETIRILKKHNIDYISSSKNCMSGAKLVSPSNATPQSNHANNSNMFWIISSFLALGCIGICVFLIKNNNQDQKTATSDKNADILYVYINGVRSYKFDYMRTTEIVFGKDSQNTDYYIDHSTVSRKHFLLQKQIENNCYCIEDLQSTNGTTVNGSRIPPHRKVWINLTDIIKAGAVTVQIKD